VKELLKTGISPSFPTILQSLYRKPNSLKTLPQFTLKYPRSGYVSMSLSGTLNGEDKIISPALDILQEMINADFKSVAYACRIVKMAVSIYFKLSGQATNCESTGFAIKFRSFLRRASS
jgi:hypothetical protein